MKKIYFPMMMTLSLSLLTACGKNSSSGSSSGSSTPAIQEQSSEGAYRAILRPFNNSLSGFLPTGAAEVKITGDNVLIKTYLDDDARVNHIQSIHTGTKCPEASDDKNADGIIDFSESMSAVGDILVPLDAEIGSAPEGAGIYPLGGGYTYSEESSLSKLETDVKSRTNQNLNLSGRVVLIHGVAPRTAIPASVSTKDALPPHSSVPIVCGILQRQN
jgi:hypothetical protein